MQVFNKIDAVRKISDFDMLRTIHPDAVCISAKTGLGLESLSQAVIAKYKGNEVHIRVTYSHTNGKVTNFLRSQGKIMDIHYNENLVLAETMLGKNQLPELHHLHPEKVELLDDV